MSIASFGRTAEELGYDSVWTSEGWGNDAFVLLSEVACVTDHIGLGTSVVNVFSRSPAVIGNAAASLARCSDGRAILGVGAGHPGSIENLHGLAYERPIRRVFETIEIIKGYTDDSDEPFEYDGEIFALSGYKPLGVPVPVYNAALGETNRRITGKLCDGWIPYNIPFPALQEAFEAVADGARDASRDPDEITVTPWVQAAVSDDPHIARQVIRKNIAEYVGGITDDTYKNAVANRFPDEASRIADLWRSGDRDGSIESVTDEMVDALGIAGTPEQARERLRTLLEYPLIDVPIVSVPYLADDEITEYTVRELAPRNL